MSRLSTYPVHKPYTVSSETKGVSYVHDTRGGKWQATLHTLPHNTAWPRPRQVESILSRRSSSYWYVAVATHPSNPQARKGSLLGQRGLYELQHDDLDFLEDSHDLIATSSPREPLDTRLRFSSRSDAAAFFHANAHNINKLFHPALGYASYDRYRD